MRQKKKTKLNGRDKEKEEKEGRKGRKGVREEQGKYAMFNLKLFC
jgi:hypothetical protein